VTLYYSSCTLVYYYVIPFYLFGDSAKRSAHGANIGIAYMGNTLRTEGTSLIIQEIPQIWHGVIERIISKPSIS